MTKSIGFAEHYPKRENQTGIVSTMGCGCCSERIETISELHNSIKRTKHKLSEAEKILEDWIEEEVNDDSC